MEPISEIEALRIERDRYKKLAASELVTAAMRRCFSAAQIAFESQLNALPPDEREALEAQLKSTIDSAIETGAKFSLDGQNIFIKKA